MWFQILTWSVVGAAGGVVVYGGVGAAVGVALGALAPLLLARWRRPRPPSVEREIPAEIDAASGYRVIPIYKTRRSYYMSGRRHLFDLDEYAFTPVEGRSWTDADNRCVELAATTVPRYRIEVPPDTRVVEFSDSGSMALVRLSDGLVRLSAEQLLDLALDVSQGRDVSPIRLIPQGADPAKFPGVVVSPWQARPKGGRS